MYKVLIADDEKIIRIALKSMISWEDLGFSVEYSAEDGLSALETVRRYSPDLVIIDIMMPVMDGIEFVKEARRDGYSGEIIILSNHQNFQYAVEALRNRVSDYIMKTDISPSSLTQCLLKIRRRLDAAAQARPAVPDESPAATDLDLLRAALKTPTRMAAEQLSDAYILFNIFTRNSLTGSAAQNSLAANALKNLTAEQIHSSNYQLLEISENSLLILAQRKTVNEMPDTAAFAQKLSRLVRLYLNTDCGFILSGLFTTCSRFAQLVSLLPEAARLVLYRGFGVVIDEDGYEACLNEEPNPAPFIEALRQYAGREDFLSCRSTVSGMLAHLKEKQYLPRHAVSLIRKIFDYLNLYETIRLSAEPDKATEIRAEFSRCCTLDEYRSCFYRLFDLLASSALSQKISGSSCRKEILLICGFIQQNMDRRITLSMLAQNVNMSENYISRLFKAETGNNIITYINQLKMEHARLLLEDKNLSVRDIALALGFDEPSYFNKLFIRFFGLSPTGYRKAVTEILSENPSGDSV